MTITITTAGIIESTIMFGIVRGIWSIIKWGFKHLETEAGQIIETHVIDGHKSRLKKCREGNCARFETGPGLLQQVEL